MSFMQEHEQRKAEENARLAEQAKNFPVTKLPYIAPRKSDQYSRHLGHAQDRNATGGRGCRK